MLSLASAGHLFPREGATDRQRAAEDSLPRYLVVNEADLVINPMWLTGGSVAVSDLNGVVSPDYRVFRPSKRVEPRFLHHLLRSDPYRDQYNLYVRANTTFDRRIQQIDLDNMPIALPAIHEQRRIADFLDDRVSRIDNIVIARRQQIVGVKAAFDVAWGAKATAIATSAPVVQMRRVLTSITDGPFGSSLTSAHYSESGTRVVRLGNLGVNEFKDEDVAFIPDEYARELSGHAVRRGDLLMAGLGDERWPLGRCCIAPDHLESAIVKADCYRIRLDARVTHAFAAWFLSSPPARERFQLLSRGATRARLNTTLAREAMVPLIPLRQQMEAVEVSERRKAELQAIEGNLARSIALLNDYKQSLITATVTGEIDVTTASKRMPA